MSDGNNEESNGERLELEIFLLPRLALSVRLLLLLCHLLCNHVREVLATICTRNTSRTSCTLIVSASQVFLRHALEFRGVDGNVHTICFALVDDEYLQVS